MGNLSNRLRYKRKSVPKKMKKLNQLRLEKRKKREEEEKKEIERAIELSKIEFGPPSTYVTDYRLVVETPWQKKLEYHQKNNTEVVNGMTFEDAVINLEQKMDEDYNFCQYLYHQMKTMNSFSIKRKLRLSIQKALLDALEKAEAQNLRNIAV